MTISEEHLQVLAGALIALFGVFVGLVLAFYLMGNVSIVVLIGNR
jgi:hypothetical protein